MANKQELLQQLQTEIQKAEEILNRYPQFRTKYAAQVAQMEVLKARTQALKNTTEMPVGKGLEGKPLDEDIPKNKYISAVSAWCVRVKTFLGSISDEDSQISIKKAAAAEKMNKHFLSAADLIPGLKTLATELTTAISAIEGESVTLGAVCAAIIPVFDKFGKEAYKYYDKADKKTQESDFKELLEKSASGEVLLDLLKKAKDPKPAQEAEEKRKAAEEAKKAAEAEAQLYAAFETQLANWFDEAANIVALSKSDSLDVKPIVAALFQSALNRNLEQCTAPLKTKLLSTLSGCAKDGELLSVLKGNVVDKLGEIRNDWNDKGRAELFEFFKVNKERTFPIKGVINMAIYGAVPMETTDFADKITNEWKSKVKAVVATAFPKGSVSIDVARLLENMKTAFGLGTGAANCMYEKYIAINFKGKQWDYATIQQKWSDFMSACVEVATAEFNSKKTALEKQVWASNFLTDLPAEDVLLLYLKRSKIELTPIVVPDLQDSLLFQVVIRVKETPVFDSIGKLLEKFGKEKKLSEEQIKKFKEEAAKAIPQELKDVSNRITLNIPLVYQYYELNKENLKGVLLVEPESKDKLDSAAHLKDGRLEVESIQVIRREATKFYENNLVSETYLTYNITVKWAGMSYSWAQAAEVGEIVSVMRENGYSYELSPMTVTIPITFHITSSIVDPNALLFKNDKTNSVTGYGATMGIITNQSAQFDMSELFEVIQGEEMSKRFKPN